MPSYFAWVATNESNGISCGKIRFLHGKSSSIKTDQTNAQHLFYTIFSYLFVLYFELTVVAAPSSIFLFFLFRTLAVIYDAFAIPTSIEISR